MFKHSFDLSVTCFGKYCGIQLTCYFSLAYNNKAVQGADLFELF